MSSGSIKLLDTNTINQIAAGEVVERPLNVIKELLENAIDAKATEIAIKIVDNFSQITVIDNGTGIKKQDLELALTQHATSKISIFADLEAHLSYGFRGEALASISSISHLSIASCQGDSGYKLANFGIEKHQIVAVSMPKGTKVEVKDLFYNVPVRKKLQRSFKTELLAAKNYIHALVLANPLIGFKLIVNDKILLNSAACKNFEQTSARVYQVMGKKFMDHAIYVDAQIDDYKIFGWVANAKYKRTIKDQQFFALNKRVIKDKLVHAALKNSALLQHDCEMCYALFLETPPNLVDINVHPMKFEVRFLESRYVHDFIKHAINKSIGQADLITPQKSEQEYIMPNISLETSEAKPKIISVKDLGLVFQTPKDVLMINLKLLKLAYLEYALTKTQTLKQYILPIEMPVLANVEQKASMLNELGFKVETLAQTIIISGASKMPYNIAKSVFKHIDLNKVNNIKQHILAQVELIDFFDIEMVFAKIYANKINTYKGKTIYKFMDPAQIIKLI